MPTPRTAGLIADGLTDRLFDRAAAARWGLSRERFAAALNAAVIKQFGDQVDFLQQETCLAPVERFLESLHVEDLALGCACADGSPAAWDHFVLTYRPELYRAARAIAGEQGRELADSIYAELFGLTADLGERRSLFRYYHGKAKLATWLRSVLAQRHVDGLRASRRLVSMDDAEAGTLEPAAPDTALDPDARTRLHEAAACVSEGLSGLDGDARLRLAYYYVHGLTLAETGRLFGEHEATASRKLEKARQTLRAAIERALAARGLRAADVERWGDVATQAWDAALAEALGVPRPDAAAQAAAAPPFKGKRTP